MIARALSAWPPLPVGVWLRRATPRLPFPLEEPHTRRFTSGRTALWHGVRALGLRAGDEVLAPAYHHGSEIQALVAAGLRPRFYSTRLGLVPDADELESLLGERTRALLLIHVLGLSQPTVVWRRWCDEHGVLLLEDVAQGWLSESDGLPAGFHADLSLFCLYKTFGLPDGAAVFLRHGKAAEPADPPSRLAGAAKANAAWLAQRWSPAGAAWTGLRGGRRRSFDATAEIALGDTSVAMSSTAEMLLSRLAAGPAAAIRRAHYRLLLERLGDMVPAEMPSLPEGAAPFAFPVWASDKSILLARLERAGIQALDYWSTPHPTLASVPDPVGARLRRHVVGLPVHQELARSDLDRIAVGVVGPRPSPRAQLTVARLAGFDGADADWSSVAERAGNIFGTPEWLMTWWRHLGRGELALYQCRSASGRLVGVLPMVRESRGAVRLLRFCSADVGDELGPICAPEDEPAVARAWRQMLHDSRADWDLALAERLPGAAAWPSLTRLPVLRREASPVLGLAGLDWDGFLASRSRNFRQQLRRFERHLVHNHGLRFRLAGNLDRLDADLDTLIALHRAQWRPRGGDAFAGSRESFHREFARIALERGWLRLWFAEINGVPAAAWYGLRFGSSECYYQAGRDPAHERHSVGVVLMAHTVREAIADGQQNYRLLRGNEDYKQRWATHDPGLDTAARAEGLTGQAALAALHAFLAIAPATRSQIQAARPSWKPSSEHRPERRGQASTDRVAAPSPRSAPSGEYSSLPGSPPGGFSSVAKRPPDGVPSASSSPPGGLPSIPTKPPAV